MTTFTIDKENQIMGYRSADDANGNPQAQQFTSARQLAKLAEKCDLSDGCADGNNPNILPVATGFQRRT